MASKFALPDSPRRSSSGSPADQSTGVERLQDRQHSHGVRNHRGNVSDGPLKTRVLSSAAYPDASPRAADAIRGPPLAGYHPPTRASTISEFCDRQNISKPLYYKLRGKGLGPKEMRFLGVVRISYRAELEWQKARENPTEAEAVVLEKAATARRERAVKAASKAIRSPLHVSRKA